MINLKPENYDILYLYQSFSYLIPFIISFSTSPWQCETHIH